MAFLQPPCNCNLLPQTFEAPNSKKEIFAPAHVTGAQLQQAEKIMTIFVEGNGIKITSMVCESKGQGGNKYGPGARWVASLNIMSKRNQSFEYQLQYEITENVEGKKLSYVQTNASPPSCMNSPFIFEQKTEINIEPKDGSTSTINMSVRHSIPTCFKNIPKFIIYCPLAWIHITLFTLCGAVCFPCLHSFNESQLEAKLKSLTSKAMSRIKEMAEGPASQTMMDPRRNGPSPRSDSPGAPPGYTGHAEEYTKTYIPGN